MADSSPKTRIDRLVLDLPGGSTEYGRQVALLGHAVSGSGTCGHGDLETGSGGSNNDEQRNPDKSGWQILLRNGSDRSPVSVLRNLGKDFHRDGPLPADGGHRVDQKRR